MFSMREIERWDDTQCVGAAMGEREHGPWYDYPNMHSSGPAISLAANDYSTLGLQSLRWNRRLGPGNYEYVCDRWFLDRDIS